MKRIAVLIIFAIIASGCVNVIEGTQGFSQSWAEQIQERVAMHNPDEVDICGDVECWTMVCRNSSNVWGIMSSFVGGSCRFENLAGETPITDPAARYEASRIRYNELTNGTESEMGIRHFMIGAGPTFADFGEANRWCNNQLDLAVQWLVGSEGAPYTSVDPSRAICLLDKDVMPLYVLFNTNGLPNATRAGEIADTLYHGGASVTHGRLWGPVGPVIITSEMDANLTNSTVRELVLQQAVAMKDHCPDGPDGEVYCMVALGARMGDYEGVQLTLSDPRADNFDMVAFGINSHRAESCDYNDLYLQAYNFSRYAWHTFDKPAIIPYILFDSVGDVRDDDGTLVCHWSEGEMIRGYSAFFPNLPAFLESGVIGVSPYDFNSTSSNIMGNPLSCEDCSIGSNIDRMQSWYGGCQGFTGIARVAESCTGCDSEPQPDCCAGEFSPTPGIPIVFPNQSGGRCNFDEQWDSLLHMQYGAGGLRDFGTPMTGELFAPMEPFVRCDACMSENINFPYGEGSPVTIPAISPFVSSEARERFPGLTTMEIACTAYPELDTFASTRNIDPMFVRAVVSTESGFDMCSIACSCDGSGTGCPGHCIPGKFSAGYNFMSDPAETCNDYINSIAGGQPTPGGPDDRPRWRWMGLGLMQVMTSPYTFWPRDEFCIYDDSPAECGEYEEYFYVTARERDGTRDMGTGPNRRTADNPERASAYCGHDFNPFEPSDAACYGTLAIEQALLAASNIVDSYRNHGVTDLFGVADNPDKERVIEYYIASHMYFGTWDSRAGGGTIWIEEFAIKKSWDPEDCVEIGGRVYGPACAGPGELRSDAPDCYGVDDFIDYVHRCKLSYEGKNDAGWNKIGVYQGLMGMGGISGCENAACPSWRRLQEAGEFDEPECGNAYLCPPGDAPEAPEGTIVDEDAEGE